ncbi:MAG: transposase [Planctomycetota bacterium]
MTAWGVAKQTLPAYSHRYSPKKFTQHQLFACLVLRVFLKTDYRGLASCLCDSPTWCEAIELNKVPHWTTFHKAARRLLRSKSVMVLLDRTVRHVMGRKRRVPLAAIDSTGLESHHASRYFIRRRSRTPNLWQTTQYTRFPKLGILVDCSNHLILGYLTDQGPKPDIQDMAPTLAQTSPHIRIEWLTADPGYDSEPNHRLCRQQQGIRSLIPPKHGRPTDKPATGRYRRLMQTRFDKTRYGQRWQVETVVSMIKRRLGPATTGRSYWARRRDLMLMVLTHNIMILWRTDVFYRASQFPFL